MDEVIKKISKILDTPPLLRSLECPKSIKFPFLGVCIFFYALVDKNKYIFKPSKYVSIIDRNGVLKFLIPLIKNHREMVKKLHNMPFFYSTKRLIIKIKIDLIHLIKKYMINRLIMRYIY